MHRFKGLTSAVLFLCLIGINGCQNLITRDIQSLLIPKFQRSEIVGFVAGFGTTFATVLNPILAAMLLKANGIC